MLVAADTHARNAFELLNKIDLPFMLCYTCVAINDQCVRTDTNRNMPDACVASTFWAIIFLGDSETNIVSIKINHIVCVYLISRVNPT